MIYFKLHLVSSTGILGEPDFDKLITEPLTVQKRILV